MMHKEVIKSMVEIMTIDEEYIAKIDVPQSLNKTTDIFSSDSEIVKTFDSLSPNFKRRVSRLQKVYSGDGAGSKQLFPEQEIVTAYGLFDVVVPPYNLDELAFYYENSFANHAAISAKVANVVGLGYNFIPTSSTIEKLELAESDQELQRAQRKVARGKSLMAEWLELMNDEDTFTHTLEKVYTDYESTGNGYIEIGRKVTGEIGYIGHIPSTTIRVRRIRDGYIQVVNQRVVFFRNFQDTTTENPVTKDTRPNELIHIKKYSPKNTYYGVPDTVSSAFSIVGDILAAKYNIDYFENKAVPRYILTLKGAKLSPESEDRFFRFMQSGLRGQNHRTLYIPLPGDSIDKKVEFDMKPIENTVQEGSFEKYHKSNINDILMSHQVPISKVGSGEGSIASAMVGDRTFKEQVSRPSQRNLEKIINKIIKEKTDMLLFKFNEFTLTDEDTQSKIDERYLRMKVIVPNEVRERNNLPVRPDGNEFVELRPQQSADQRARALGTRQRDQNRTDNSTDSLSSTNMRAPGGEGRQNT